MHGVFGDVGDLPDFPHEFCAANGTVGMCAQIAQNAHGQRLQMDPRLTVGKRPVFGIDPPRAEPEGMLSCTRAGAARVAG
ncbi:hypothetical protein GCM10017621_22510 [Maricaulis virginensis]|uniref:Uncharacterized protein n=1 Tax=Maricaulis virginensis TaxID=144022 RepID=A0A9W6ILZ1_9PROT|nr:hypothetical protein GCM10017621_22510 [Maricaulis virginensis]